MLSDNKYKIKNQSSTTSMILC